MIVKNIQQSKSEYKDIYYRAKCLFETTKLVNSSALEKFDLFLQTTRQNLSARLSMYIALYKFQNTDIFNYVQEQKIKSLFNFHNRLHVTLGYCLSLKNTKYIFV